MNWRSVKFGRLKLRQHLIVMESVRRLKDVSYSNRMESINLVAYIVYPLLSYINIKFKNLCPRMYNFSKVSGQASLVDGALRPFFYACPKESSPILLSNFR
jgi:hypothetical protein